MILVVDNYDSFTYNLVQYLGELGAVVEVVRNDEISLDAIAARKQEVEGVLLSPGPGTPDQAGITLELLSRYAATLPILGVCLGHQAIGQAFGSRVVRAERLMHGRTSQIHHAGKGVFAGLPSPFVATRYHSLIVERDSLSPELEVTAWTEAGEIMGLAHRTLDVEGVQFHPESFLTEHGHALLSNFLKRLPERGARSAS
jgi:anthranilate synthase/aminodeoxychorismate synthase-like glutamine amidotransferase